MTKKTQHQDQAKTMISMNTIVYKTTNNRTEEKNIWKRNI